MARFGSAEIVISDQGREFINAVSKCLFHATGTEHRILSAYHPQTNGLVEHFNQTLQKSLLKFARKEQDDWDDYLDAVLFAYRTSVQKSTNTTPFEVMYLRYDGNDFMDECSTIVILLHFVRKPILPIEIEILGNMQDNSDDQDINVENFIQTMKDVKKGIYQKVKKNIDKSQVRQKNYYDKKLKRIGVSI